MVYPKKIYESKMQRFFIYKLRIYNSNLIKECDCMDWWNVLIFGVIPVLTVIIIFNVKKKLLWIAPLISTAFAFITYMIVLAPITIVELFNNNEWRSFFLLAMLIHFGIAVVHTAIAYFAAYKLKRKKK